MEKEVGMTLDEAREKRQPREVDLPCPSWNLELGRRSGGPDSIPLHEHNPPVPEAPGFSVEHPGRPEDGDFLRGERDGEEGGQGQEQEGGEGGEADHRENPVLRSGGCRRRAGAPPPRRTPG
jgi:hypothetical protein